MELQNNFKDVKLIKFKPHPNPRRFITIDFQPGYPTMVASGIIYPIKIHLPPIIEFINLEIQKRNG